MESLYIYLQSDHCRLDYPENTAASFTVKLPRRLHLHGQWSCGLSDIIMPPVRLLNRAEWAPALPLNICTTLCEDSIITSMQAPVLRRIVINDREQREGTRMIFNPAYYIPIVQNDFETITLYINADFQHKVTFDDGILNCTLHFKKKQ